MSLKQIWDDNIATSLERAVKAVYDIGLEEDIPRGDIISTILDFAGTDWRNAAKFIPILTYTQDDIRYGCQTDEYGTVVDPITLSEIPLERFISFEEDGKKWCFDILTLLESVERGRPINPYTRNELPEYIQIQLQEYKEKERQVTITVKVRDGEFGFRFTKGYPMVELVIEIFREWSDLISNVVPPTNLFSKNIIPNITNFERPVEESLELFVKPTEDFSTEELLNYYIGINNSLRKRNSLQGWEDISHDIYESLLKRISFMDCTHYLSPINMFINVLTPTSFSGNRKIIRNPFNYLKKVEDYFKPLNTVTNTDKWKISNIAKLFIGWFEFPEDIDKVENREHKWKIVDCVSNTLTYILEYYAKRKDFKHTKEVIRKIGKLHYHLISTEDILLFVNNFSPIDVYDLLKKVRGIFYRFRDILPEDLPQSFLKSIYYPRLLGAKDKYEEQAIIDLITTNTTAVNLTPISQAKIVGILQRLKYYEFFKDTLDYKTLYTYISEDDLTTIDEAIPPEKRVERLLREGGRWTSLSKESIRKEFEKVLESGTDKFDHFGFGELIGLVTEPYLKPDEIFDYLLQAKDKNRENIFVGIMSSLGEFLFLGEEDEIKLPDYMSLICRVASEESIPENIKLAGFKSMLIADFSIYDNLLKEFYDCIGLERSITVYSQSKSKIYFPEITRKELYGLIDKNFDILKLAVDSNLIKQEEIYDIYNRTKTRNPKARKLIELFNKDTLQKLDAEEILTYALDIYNYDIPKEIFLYNYIRNNIDIQQELALRILKEKLNTDDISILSLYGVNQLMRIYGEGLVQNRGDVFDIDKTENYNIELKGWKGIMEGK